MRRRELAFGNLLMAKRKPKVIPKNLQQVLIRKHGKANTYGMPKRGRNRKVINQKGAFGG